jgi:hypothetical protein
VNVIDLAGAQTKVGAGQELALTTTPVFVTGIPESLAARARSNVTKPYPWGAHYAHAQEVTCEMGAVNREDGLKQVNPNTTAVVNGLVESFVRPNFAAGGEGRYLYFRVDPQFVPYGTSHLEITIVARRMAPDKEAGMNLTYESADHGYTNANKWNKIISPRTTSCMSFPGRSRMRISSANGAGTSGSTPTGRPTNFTSRKCG